MFDILEEGGKFFVVDDKGAKLNKEGFASRPEAEQFMGQLEKGKSLSGEGGRKVPVGPPMGAPPAMAGPPMAGPPMGGPPGGGMPPGLAGLLSGGGPPMGGPPKRKQQPPMPPGLM